MERDGRPASVRPAGCPTGSRSHPATHAPASATPLRLSLVPGRPRVHGAQPRARPAARVRLMQPAAAGLLASDRWHAGRANGLPAASTGSMKASVMVGNPSTGTDEADVLLSLSLTDVRSAAGSCRLRGRAVRTVRAAPHRQAEPALQLDTGHDGRPHLLVRCDLHAHSGLRGPDRLRPDSAQTAPVPSTVQEGRRAIWELGQGRVFDGGPDGDTATQDNTLFAVGGVFVP